MVMLFGDLNGTIRTAYHGPLVGVLAVFNVAVHLFVAGNLEYHRDELLYFAQGLHPAFGYETVPPLMGWIAFGIRSLFGTSVLAVRLFPAVLGGVLVVVSANLAKELGGGSYSRVLAALGVICTPVMLRAFHLFQPVATDIVLWTVILYTVLRYLNTNKSRYMLMAGVFTGLGLMNKYLVMLLVLALLTSMLFSVHRVLLRGSAIRHGMLIACVIFLPNIVWQIANDFPVFGHMQALHDEQLVNVERGGFLVDQLLMPFAAVVLVLPGLFHLLRSERFRFLGWAVVIIVSVLLILRGKSYYTAGLFPLLIAAGAVAWERVVRWRSIRIALPALLIGLTVPVLPFGLPIHDQSGMVAFFNRLEKDHGLLLGRRFDDNVIHSLPQDYADELGWEELTLITSRAYALVPDPSRCLIYCQNYGQAGAIAIIGRKYQLPEPVSFHESFQYWAPSSFDPDIEHFIYINDELGEDVDAMFQDIQNVGSIGNVHAREAGCTVYLCSRPVRSFNAFWKEVLARRG